jgi:Asp-tRNA(Asn)/Glu-tRNA(Gln) amidotransferase A subunit family amidase
MATRSIAVDTFATAEAMLTALRERRISSRELTELHLERIARHNPALNAIVVPAGDPLAAAEAADNARAAGQTASLLGLPVTLKESINVIGMPTTAPITLRTAFEHLDVKFPPDAAERRRTIDVDGQPVPYLDGLVYPGVATLCGQPATAFPVAISNSGLPIGLQAIGPYLEDRTPIRFAALATREMGGFVRPPAFDDEP